MLRAVGLSGSRARQDRAEGGAGARATLWLLACRPYGCRRSCVALQGGCRVVAGWLQGRTGASGRLRPLRSDHASRRHGSAARTQAQRVHGEWCMVSGACTQHMVHGKWCTHRARTR